MPPEPEDLREEIKELYAKRKRGDLNERSFQKLLTFFTIELYRAVVRKRMAKDEPIEQEHHSIQAHFKWTQSLLKEPEQEASSLFATDRRLFCVQSRIIPDQPPTADSRDHTRVVLLPYDRVLGLSVHRRIRWGEFGVGALILASSLVFWEHLDITGWVMSVIGTLGILHAVLLPTRWIEVESGNPSPNPEPVRIYAVRKKSGRQLVRLLREKTRSR
ncbi:MAG: hypothetical protein KBH99_02910 [Syntrophobacteraceae bacterium]|nr:hypothetical protein [Syntrophobacteraceae bacterium]